MKPRVARAIAVLSLLLAGVAHGHAFLEHAEPRVGSTVGSPPSSLSLTFTEGIEPAFSKVELTMRMLLPAGAAVSLPFAA